MNRLLVEAAFHKVFGRAPVLVTRAPGRVNLIGEHTDYNEGWVMPVAIEAATWTAIADRSDRLLRVHAGDLNEETFIDLDRPEPPRETHWQNYVLGIAAELEQDGHRLRGAEVWFASDVPQGAGLSSSAALEMSLGLALLVHAGRKVDRTRLAMAGQRAEHRYAGTRCGLMDQCASVYARAGHALMLDCRSLALRFLRLTAGLRIAICDTGVRHRLADSEYNLRRAQCEESVALLSKAIPPIRSLRDLSPEQARAHRGVLPDVLFRRCRHVVEENARVTGFAHALKNADVEALGRFMAASHASLRDDYEVSCPELDLLVDLAAKAPGVRGARMTGGGFGGCTVNLVDYDQVEAFRSRLTAGYAQATGRALRVWITAAGDGAAVVP